MQFKDLVKDVRNMTDEQLLEHVRGIRHNKYVARPAAAAKRKEAARKVTKKTTSAIDKILNKMSPAERKALLSQLNGD